jgi:cobalt-zinc-cadmium efflux system membrane fusion protein
MNKNISCLVIGLLVFALSACGRGGGNEEAEGGHAEHGEEGAHEEAGAPGSGGVELSREQIIAAGIKLERVKVEAATGFVRGTGEIHADPDRTVQLASSVAGRVTMARGAIGEHVRAGQALATVVGVEQPAVSAELKSAEARLALAEEDLKRERSLFERGLAPKRDFLAAEASARSARAELEGARLRAGAMASTISTPISGQIAERNVTIGQVVDAGTPLYVIVSPENLQAIVDLYDRDLARVRVGAEATLYSQGMAEMSVTGRVAAIGPVIDETTRTGKVRVELKDRDGRLRPGTFVSASIRVEGSAGRDSAEVMLLPAESVCRLGDRRVVFVAAEDTHGYLFEPRDVETGFRNGDLVEIRSGVTSEDLIATEGAFSVLSALRSGELGEGHAD